MDPITQGVVGLSATQVISTKKEKTMAALLGFISGMAADLDVLIRSSSDPLLALEFHRHFTHSLVFIPLGALLCAWALRGVFKKRLQNLDFKRTYLFCFAGYATHALLDACTTYGTQLLWPFSNMRVAWNNVSVVDPLFTIPLLIFMLLAVSRKSTLIAVCGVAVAVTYLLLGVVQKQRALEVAQQLAISRGHTPVNLGVKPSFANIIVWKSVYEYEGRYYVDAVRVLADTKIYRGTSTPKLSLDEHFAWLDKNTQQARDVTRFAWFSNQHLGLDPDNPNRIIDIRYSLIPNKMTGMWGIVLDPKADAQQHVVWNTTRSQAMASVHELLAMIRGD